MGRKSGDVKFSKQRAAADGSSPSKKKRRSAVLNMLSVNEEYVQNEDFTKKFREELKGKPPFPHWQLNNFVNNSSGIVEEIETELQDFPNWRRKENDLYSLYQTEDFKSLEISDYPNLFSFRQFMYGSVRDWLSTVSGVSLLPQVDMNGSCYSYTDGLLPHSDQIDTRRFAFVYYVTPFVWDKKNGGELNLYFSNATDEPTEVSVRLPPTRNSLVLFEVSHRSWHRVAEILSQEDPRLSINGWFHSERRLDQKLPQAIILPRSIPAKSSVKLTSFVSANYLDLDKTKEIQTVFGDKSEICLKQFLQESVSRSLLTELKKTKFTESGPPNKRCIHQCDISKLRGKLEQLAEVFSSNVGVDYFYTLTGCDIKDSAVSVSVTRLSHGSYTVVGDEDAEQAEKDGFTLDAHLYLGDTQWSDESGGDVIYVGKDDDEELITVHPETNSLSLVLRDPEVFSFTKYVNSRAHGHVYVISVTFHHVNMDDVESEEDAEDS